MTDTKPKPAKKPRKRNYLNNKDLLAQVIQSKEDGKMTPTLAKMLTMLCDRYGKRANYASYTYNDDMRAYAMMMLCKTWAAFKPEKSNNPFAFYTQCIKHSFSQFLNSERKQRDIRDELLVDQGLSPSYTYQMNHQNPASKPNKQNDQRIGESSDMVKSYDEDGWTNDN